jgi:hypothetical protein
MRHGFRVVIPEFQCFQYLGSSWEEESGEASDGSDGRGRLALLAEGCRGTRVEVRWVLEVVVVVPALLIGAGLLGVALLPLT